MKLKLTPALPPIELLEVFNLSTVKISVASQPVQVIDALLTTKSHGQEQTIQRRVRLRMELAVALIQDLHAHVLRAQGSPPPLH